MSDPIYKRLKEIVVEALQLEGVDPERLADDEPLMESEMGLDSIDALELIVQVEKQFGIKIKSSEETRDALKSLDSLAAYIRIQQQAQTAPPQS